MISDDDVLRVFEEADPARRPDRSNDRVDGADYLAALRHRSVPMTFTEFSETESSQTETRPSRSWAWVGAAAAAAMVMVGGVALLARDGAGPRSEASTDAAVASAEIDVAERFIAAVNDRDLAAVEAVSTDGLTIDSDSTIGDLRAGELPSLMAWYDAFDWRWEDASCQATSPGADIRCELFERNRLTDLTGAERPATASFTMTDGKVESVNVDADGSDYARVAFFPFKNWVRVNHPDDLTRMWTGDYPVLSSESVALFDQHLTEYAALLSAEIDVAERFIGAVNDRDLAVVEAVSTDGLTIDSTAIVAGLQFEELPSLMAWYDAFDWRWDDHTCQTTSLGADVRCELFERNRLTDLTGAVRPAIVSFAMTDGKIESVDVDADLSDYSQDAFTPFRNWVRVNHPDDFTRMWNGNVPVLSTESAALFDQHLTEYTDHLLSTTDD